MVSQSAHSAQATIRSVCSIPLLDGSCQCFAVKLPLSTPYRWARGEQKEREVLIVKVTQGGAQGLGEIALPPGDAIDCQRAAVLLRGFAAAETRGSFGREADPSLSGLDAFALRVRCGFVTAWYVAQAAAKKMPLHSFYASEFGLSSRSVVPVNALITEATPEAAALRAADQAALGIRVFKIKLVGDHDADFARVAAVRRAQPAAEIRLDPNGVWSRSEAPALLERYEPLIISYVEDPLPVQSALEDMRAVHDSSAIPLALDEWCADLASARQLIEARAADVLIIKPQRVGGPDAALQIAREAGAAGIPVTLTGSLETAVGSIAHVHTAAVMPGPTFACGLATSRFFASDVGVFPPISQGVIVVPMGPGLGIPVSDLFCAE